VVVFVLVAVKSLAQVKITDFGLAKVLEHNQPEIYASGGKVGIQHGFIQASFGGGNPPKV